jgi:WD40 repeat protein
MAPQEEIIDVANLLAMWKTRISTHNAMDLYDINRLSEYWAAKLLNLVFDLKLINLNVEQKNFPAIDLGDKENKIAYQVTSRTDARKIKETLKKFAERNFNNFYTNLRFLILNDHKPDLSNDENANNYSFFNVETGILNYKDLLTEIKKIFAEDKEKFSKIRNFLAEEFGAGGKIEVNQTLREGAKNYYNALRGPNGRFRFLRISDIILPGSQDQWLETNVEVNQSNEINKKTILEALPELWNYQVKHAVIVGAGGMGKTVSLLHWWENLLDPEDTVKPIPVFIALNELNQVQEGRREDFIVSRIWKNYARRSLAREQVEKAMITPLVEGEKFVPSMVLLLDGFNEITVEKNELLVELNDLTEQCPGLQVVITSRYDMRGNFNWSYWHLVKLKELEESRIEEYLAEKDITVPQQIRLRTLIKNPMMMTLYAASCEVQKHYHGSTHCCFKNQVETPGELLWNFMEAQAAKLPERVGEDEKQIAYYKFLLKFFLPGLGFAMEKAGLFDFSLRQLYDHMEALCRRFGQDDFFDTFTQFDDFGRALPVGESVDRMDRRERAAKLKKILCRELSLLVEEGGYFRFLHQDFRDFFAAVHILNEVKMGLNRNEVAEVLTGGMISFYPQRYIGEIEGEHYCKPDLEEGTSWQIQSNEFTLLAQALEKCRGNFATKYAYAVLNILETWKQLRGEWSGLDLSRLDLSKVLINGTVCSRFYGDTYLFARFDESLIPANSIFSEGHEALVSKVIYSPDGQKILSASWDGTIKEWDVAGGVCLRTYQKHENVVTNAVYSPNGKKILSASADKTIKEWDVTDGKCMQTYKGHENVVNSALYSPDGKKILLALADKSIREWDAAGAKYLRTYQGHESSVTNAVYSPDGQKILSASADKSIREWDVAGGKCLRTYQGHENVVNSAVYSPDGKKILSASADKSIKVWDVAGGKCLRTYRGHENVTTSAVYSPDGKKILSASGDKMIKEWDVASGICLRTYQGHIMQVTSAVYNHDGHKILSASADKTIKEWDVVSGTCLRTYQGYEDFIESAVYRKDGKKILCASDDKTIKEWDVGSGICQRIYQGHTHWIEIAVYDPNSQKILSYSNDAIAKEWEVETGRCLETGNKIDKALLKHYPDFFNNIKTFKNKVIEIDKKDKNQIKIIDRQTGKILQTFENIPGLFIQECSFKNLHSQSQLNDEDKELLKMYGAIV